MADVMGTAVSLTERSVLLLGSSARLECLQLNRCLYPALLPPTVANGLVTLTWPTAEGVRLQQCADLATAEWEDVPGSEHSANCSYLWGVRPGSIVWSSAEFSSGEAHRPHFMPNDQGQLGRGSVVGRACAANLRRLDGDGSAAPSPHQGRAHHENHTNGLFVRRPVGRLHAADCAGRKHHRIREADGCHDCHGRRERRGRRSHGPAYR